MGTVDIWIEGDRRGAVDMYLWRAGVSSGWLDHRNVVMCPCVSIVNELRERWLRWPIPPSIVRARRGRGRSEELEVVPPPSSLPFFAEERVKPQRRLESRRRSVLHPLLRRCVWRVRLVRWPSDKTLIGASPRAKADGDVPSNLEVGVLSMQIDGRNVVLSCNL